MEVVTTLVGEDGKTSQIKSVSIAEEEMKSIKKSARMNFDEKSQKSFARSIRSRKMGGVSHQLIEALQDRLSEAETKIEDLKSTIDTWSINNEPSWNLISKNQFDLGELLSNFASQGGYVGCKDFEINPLGLKS